MYRIFIVEDDLTIARGTAEHLMKWGFEAEWVTDFEKVMSKFVEFDPQIVLMDVLLPFYNGYHWCTQIRKISKVPIIFISSAGDNMNIVMAMNMGADDFIPKPFDLSVLAAKVQAMLRRAYAFGGEMNVMEIDGAVLSIGDGMLRYEDQKIELTKNELKILQLLFENAGNTVSRDDIMICLWHSDSFIDDNTLSVNVARLRKKLEDIGLTDFIETKKGMGYIVGKNDR